MEGIMRIIKFVPVFAVCLSLFLSAASGAFAADGPKTAQKAGAIKWTISVKPLAGMVNLYLKESGSGKDVRNAKVMAVITMPGGEKVEKEMMKMTMKQKIKGKVVKKGIYHMFSLDMSAKGSYIFDITVKAGKREIQINAKYDVK